MYLKLFLVFLIFYNILYAKEIKYKVKKGDSLYSIASKYLRESKYIYVQNLIKDIKKNNKIKKFIKPGQILKIELLDERLKTERIRKPGKVKALYYPVSSVVYKDFLRRIKVYKQVGINSVVIDIKNMTGEITVPFGNILKKEIKKRYWSSIGDLNKLIYYLHKENIYVITRVVCFHDEIMAKARRDLRVYSNNVAWVNPENSEVQNYLLALIDELLKYPIDELQLDYVRFPASNIKVGGQKKDIIIGFLKKVYKKTRKAGINLGLDVFGIALWQRKVDEEAIGQNLREMADYSDVILPMIYPSHFSNPFNGIKNPGDNPDLIIKMSFQRVNKIFKDKDIEIRPYLQAFSWKVSKYDKDYILKQLKEIKEHGFIFWNARGKYQPVYEALNYLKLKEKKHNLKEGKKKLIDIIENIENKDKNED